LRAFSAQARTRYLAGKTVPNVTTSAPSVAARLAPNPLPQGADLRLIMPTEQRANVRFFNILGQLVGEVRQAEGSPQGIRLNLPVMSSASGLLIYRIDASGFRSSGKLLILK
jgi:hypothetical protein